MADGGYGTEYDDENQVSTLPNPENPRVFVVADQKSSVGKTTATMNITTAFIFGGLNVLIVGIGP